MKKFILITLMCALCLSSCGDNTDSAKETGTTATEKADVTTDSTAEAED